MKYANIVMQRQGRCTIGDDIQLLAIENLYKHMGINYDDVVRIPFHELATYDGEYLVLPISYPLYGYNKEMNITQYSNRIIPVFLGFATLTQHYSKEEVDYLRTYQPIGCRDQYTMEALRNHNITAYLNGCMTATLPIRRKDGNRKYRKIYCVDIPADFIQHIPEGVIKDSVFTNHVYMSDECEFGTEEKAREVYEEYVNEAKMIVTTRMHAALPCLAAGIPVVLIKDYMSQRFPFLKSLIPVYTEEQYSDIIWDPSPVDYEDVKQTILSTTGKRLRSAYDKYNDIYSISDFYESTPEQDLFIDGLTNTIEYLKNNYQRDDNFEYVLWAITQTADNIYHYIESNYPNAVLKAVIDRDRRVSFHGTQSTSKEWLKGNSNPLVFVCAPAAISESTSYLHQINHSNYYQCWADKLPR